ncbi:MAG TPA: hypothetical protein VEP90_20720 [Methylomirabilota bacterium]|nr:hypothetical protein [Methylomirabilota bacterium]
MSPKQTQGPKRTNYAFGNKQYKPFSQVPASPTQVQDAKSHPITDKPSPTNPHWGTNLGVPMMNPTNPYEQGEEVNG